MVIPNVTTLFGVISLLKKKSEMALDRIKWFFVEAKKKFNSSIYIIMTHCPRQWHEIPLFQELSHSFRRI